VILKIDTIVFSIQQMAWVFSSRSRERVSLNEWHTATLRRTGRQGSLQVDDQSLVTGQSRGRFTQLTLTLDLFVGGHQNFDEIPAVADVSRSFRGCIQKVSATFFPYRY